jgi:hypothetical protein
MASLHLVGADVRHGGRQAPGLRHYGAKSGTARVGPMRSRLTRYEAARAARSGTFFPTTFLLVPRLHDSRQDDPRRSTRRDCHCGGTARGSVATRRAAGSARRILGEVRLPIDNFPGGERRHHLLALLERHLEHRAVAPCMNADISGDRNPADAGCRCAAGTARTFRTRSDGPASPAASVLPRQSESWSI